jgi:ATP-dependent helicase/nuclease subunit A
MSALTHTMIRASAGSGKTTQLAWRFIALLAHDVPPERIVALTFSRKAALEMFERVVNVLLEAVESPDRAAWITSRLEPAPPAPPDYLRLLRRLLDVLHRLRVGTLDSFTVGLVRAFPFELGAGPAFATGDDEGAQAKALLDRALLRLLDPARTPPAAAQEFFEKFKLARYGDEQRGLHDHLIAFAAEHLHWLRLHPDSADWGDPARIWPQGLPWLHPAHADTTPIPCPDLTGWHAVLARQVEDLIALAPGFHPRLHGPKVLKLVDRLLPLVGDLRAGRAELLYQRKAHAIGPAGCAALLDALQRVAFRSWSAAVTSTQALHGVLDRVATAREQAAAETGFLTFADVQARLSPRRGDSAWRLDDLRRLQMEFRLDGGIDHWLLDEFQDTSDLQWSILENLVNEAVTDPEGRRSLFLVGDVKQSIYRWRGGNPLLFDAIAERYGDHLVQRRLDRSWRSAPAVLELVNRVFALEHACPVPDEARAHWRAQWRPHEPGRPAEELPPGYAAVIEAVPHDEESALAARERVLAERLRALDIGGRGWTCAVLCRSNETAAGFANALRRLCPGLPVRLEGRAALLDDAAVRLLLAFVRLASHPGDPVARAHLRAGPLRDWLAAHPEANRPAQWRRDLQARGLAGFLRAWQDRLAGVIDLPARTRDRLRELRDAAAAFDEANPPDPDRFLREMEALEVQSPPAVSGVRLMTVHAAKGLEFDVVFLPDLEDKRGGLAGGGAVEWLRREEDPAWLLMPPATVWVEHDPVTQAALQHERAQRGGEALCVQYVAFTRAKTALYALVDPLKPDSAAKSANALLRDQLQLREAPGPVLWETGDPDWYRARSADVPPLPGPAPAPPSPPVLPVAPVLGPTSPSARGEGAVPRPAADLFRGARLSAKARGLGVHALFEAVEWLDDLTLAEALAQAERSEPDPALRAEFATALRHPEVAARLRAPSGPCRLWREQAFDWREDDRLLTGVADRVVVHLHPDGTPRAAEILDFKTDRLRAEEVAERAEHHRPQLDTYRRLLARLLQLPASAIAVWVVFTDLPAVAELPIRNG